MMIKKVYLKRFLIRYNALTTIYDSMKIIKNHVFTFLSFHFFFISGELSTEAINHDTEETRIRRATRRGKYYILFTP